MVTIVLAGLLIAGIITRIQKGQPFSSSVQRGWQRLAFVLGIGGILQTGKARAVRFTTLTEICDALDTTQRNCSASAPSRPTKRGPHAEARGEPAGSVIMKRAPWPGPSL